MHGILQFPHVIFFLFGNYSFEPIAKWSSKTVYIKELKKTVIFWLQFE